MRLKQIITNLEISNLGKRPMTENFALYSKENTTNINDFSFCWFQRSWQHRCRMRTLRSAAFFLPSAEFEKSLSNSQSNSSSSASRRNSRLSFQSQAISRPLCDQSSTTTKNINPIIRVLSIVIISFERYSIFIVSNCKFDSLPYLLSVVVKVNKN